jgi:hypothetical protein
MLSSNLSRNFAKIRSSIVTSLCVVVTLEKIYHFLTDLLSVNMCIASAEGRSCQSCHISEDDMSAAASMANIPVINVVRCNSSSSLRLGPIRCVLAGIRLRAATILLLFVLMLFHSFPRTSQVLRVWVSVDDYCMSALRRTSSRVQMATIY